MEIQFRDKNIAAIVVFSSKAQRPLGPNWRFSFFWRLACTGCNACTVTTTAIYEKSQYSIVHVCVHVVYSTAHFLVVVHIVHIHIHIIIANI